jgi:hypothetical protein
MPAMVEDKPKRTLPTGRRPKYPWAEWFDGKTHTITRGEDFQVPLMSMRGILHQSAKAKDGSVETYFEGNNVVVFVFTPNQTVHEA